MTDTSSLSGTSLNLDNLVHAINEAISDGEGTLGPANLLHQMNSNGWMLIDDRDPSGTQPNNEVLIQTIIDAWNDAMVDGMGEFSKYRLEHQLKRHDLALINVNPCIIGKCMSPRVCNDFSECDAKFAKKDVAETNVTAPRNGRLVSGVSSE